MALMAFGMYLLLTGFIICDGGYLSLALLALSIPGIVGLACLFSRDCRKAFGVN